MIERMDEQIKTLCGAYKKELDNIENAFYSERRDLLQAHKNKWYVVALMLFLAYFMNLDNLNFSIIQCIKKKGITKIFMRCCMKTISQRSFLARDYLFFRRYVTYSTNSFEKL